MVEIYTRIDWVNKKDGQTTPLGATNLNKMDAAISEMDKRIVELDAVKADKLTVNTMLADCEYDEETGIVKLTRKNGEQIIFDLNIEKIPVAFALSESGVLTMTTEDGTEWTADIGAMIPVLTFNNSDTVNVIVTGSGKNKTYSFEVKDGSITEDKLRPDYLAEIKVESSKAVASATNAATSEHNAAESAKTAQECKEQAGKTVENLVPAWARQESKPEYTAVEVGADPAGTADAAVEQLGAEVFKSYRGELENINTAPSAVKSGCYKVFNTGVIYDLLLCFNSTVGSATALQVLLSYDLKKCLIRPAINNGKWGPWRPLAFADDFPTAMTGATADADGASGLVPAPLKGDQNKFLRADGTWVAPPESTLEETDPTVPDWAKQPTKPVYTAAEVGADAAGAADEVMATVRNNYTTNTLTGVETDMYGGTNISYEWYNVTSGGLGGETGVESLNKALLYASRKIAGGMSSICNKLIPKRRRTSIGNATAACDVLITDNGIITLRVYKISNDQLMAVNQYVYVSDTYGDSNTFVGKLAANTGALSNTYGTIAVSTADEAVKVASVKGYRIEITVMDCI